MVEALQEHRPGARVVVEQPYRAPSRPQAQRDRLARVRPAFSSFAGWSFRAAGVPSSRRTGRTSAAIPCIGGPSGRRLQRSRKRVASSGRPAIQARPVSPECRWNAAASSSGTVITGGLPR
ncbi:hypothetical protein AB0M95_36770 [Sphaerisporangium sp. NPDC051017]|uniref:hypothetical protein n=1 Tax=Sphaerisporangium sp. NPDC051017 TaxID=3154636 RepID=UPI0034327FEF